MKRLSLIALFLGVLVALAPAANAGKSGGSGIHFQGSEPSCSVSGLTVDCTSSDIAGVGGFAAHADLAVTVHAVVDCTNNGRHFVPNKTTDSTTDGTTGQIEPQNGHLLVPALSATGSLPTLDPARDCPNKNWSASISSYTVTWTYDIWFDTNPPYVFFHLAG